MAFDVRRVVTGHDAAGRPVWLSDGTPAATVEAPNGTAVSDLFLLDGPPAGAAAGGDPTGPRVLEPPPGGCSCRVIRFPPPPPGAPVEEHWVRVPGDDPARPGMHATDTLDFMIVLHGRIVLGLDDGEHHLAAGDTVIQRGTDHRWRVEGDEPCTYLVVMLRTDPAAAAPAVSLAPRASAAPTGFGPRRLVTATDGAGRSFALLDGEPPLVHTPIGPDGAVMVDLWQTGGPLRRPDQGGDPGGAWELDPLGGGIAFRLVRLPAGHDPGSRGWHTTPSIDLDLILSGRMELALPDAGTVVLDPGDAVIQRATEHKWQPLGDEAVRMAAVMLTVPV